MKSRRTHIRFIRLARATRLVAIIGLIMFGLAANGHARTVTLRWYDPNPDPSPVSGFQLHVGTESRNYTLVYEVGMLEPDEDRVRSASVEIPDTVDVYVAMTSYADDGSVSPLSNEKVWAAPPPPPLPLPLPLPPNAQITAPEKTVTITAGETVFFSGNAELGRKPYNYEWDFDFGRSGVPDSSAATPGSVTFDIPGNFTVRLGVTDADGSVDASPAETSINVEAADLPEPPPIGNGSFPAGDSAVVEQIASGLTSPVYLTAPRGDPRLFVAEAGGVIRIIDNGTILPTPFLDLGFNSTEQELLSFAFEPEYDKTGTFYVHWIDDSGDSDDCLDSDYCVVLSRFEIGSDADVADPSSEEVLLAVPQPFDSQNGGAIAFSPVDGFLYIGMGDGGSTDDPFNVSQDGSELLGKLLRIDVSPDSGYAIPDDNPFKGVAGVRDEIWAFGVRNPYRFSFDRDLGDLWLADEGQDLREEINHEPADGPGGNNYGWDVMEGTACTSPGCDDESLTPPYHEYAHDDDSCSITGGYVYRGTEDTLYGEYFYGDYCSGAIWSINPNTGAGTNWTAAFGRAAGKRFEIASFGEGGGGALFVLHENGDIFRIGAVAPACSDQLDNDGDGGIDTGRDPGCRDENSDIEDPVCNDGIDNDGDDMIDALDPECEAAWATSEAVAEDGGGGGGGGGGGKKCGLGAELAFLLPPVMWLRRRRRSHSEPAPQLSRFSLDRNA
ncbi:MAG: PQQ-dependent sugar dehydrogenase [Deltaproteobacteria bacterium]|nr:PQQ-dependent sugar dehydrogenase [Deltaproteobacteria bacterium]